MTVGRDTLPKMYKLNMFITAVCFLFLYTSKLSVLLMLCNREGGGPKVVPYKGPECLWEILKKFPLRCENPVFRAWLEFFHSLKMLILKQQIN